MDVQRIERITDFMGNTRRKHRQCRQTLALDRLFCHSAILGDIAQNNCVTHQVLSSCVRVLDLFVQLQWRDIKI